MNPEEITQQFMLELQKLNAVEDAAEACTKKKFDVVDRSFSFGQFLKLVHMYFVNEICDVEELAKEFKCSPIYIDWALERMDYFLEKEFNLFMILRKYKKKYIQNLKEENGS